MAWFNFRKKNTAIGRGTGDYVFEPNVTLPRQSPISGATAVRHLWAIYQPPQVYVLQQSVPTQGLGGLTHGITVMQPLINK